MSLVRWFVRSMVRNSRSGRSGHSREAEGRRRATRPAVMLLEDRLAPAILTVNSVADTISAASSALTLPEAVALIDTGGTATDVSGYSLLQAKSSQVNTSNPFGVDDTIQFEPSLFGSTQFEIVLSDGALRLDRSLSIVGPGEDRLAVSGDNQNRVFEVAAGASVSISGLTITDGTASADGGSAAVGGGIINSGTLALSNVNVVGNSANSGGGIFNSGAMSLTDSTVTDNTAIDCAGIDTSGTLILVESVVSGNSAEFNGGLANYGGAVTLQNSIVSGNTAEVAGGIGNYSGGVMAIFDSSVVGNSADTGGGILNMASMVLTDSTVSSNKAACFDGGVDNTGNLTLTESVISGNSAVLTNGGLANYGGMVMLRDSTISGNTALTAGGLGNYMNGTMTLTDCTVASNSAAVAAGIYNTATISLTDSVVVDNVASEFTGGIENVNGNLALTGSTVSGNTALEMNGGIANYAGAVSLDASTVFGNSAPVDAAVGNYADGTLSLTDSIANIGVQTPADGTTPVISVPVANGTTTNYADLTVFLDVTASANLAGNGGSNAAALTMTDRTVADSAVSDNLVIARPGLLSIIAAGNDCDAVGVPDLQYQNQNETDGPVQAGKPIDTGGSSVAEVSVLGLGAGLDCVANGHNRTDGFLSGIGSTCSSGEEVGANSVALQRTALNLHSELTDGDGGAGNLSLMLRTDSAAYRLNLQTTLTLGQLAGLSLLWCLDDAADLGEEQSTTVRRSPAAPKRLPRRSGPNWIRS